MKQFLLVQAQPHSHATSKEAEPKPMSQAKTSQNLKQRSPRTELRVQEFTLHCTFASRQAEHPTPPTNLDSHPSALDRNSR